MKRAGEGLDKYIDVAKLINEVMDTNNISPIEAINGVLCFLLSTSRILKIPSEEFRRILTSQIGFYERNFPEE